MPTLIEAVTSYRNQLRDAIIARGTAGKTAVIRSGKPIHAIHEAVKSAIEDEGIASERIAPTRGSAKGEMVLTGYVKKKRQDICIKPEGLGPSQRDRLSSLLKAGNDKFGKAFTEQTIAINVRSQFSSLAKNFDTLFERTVAEAHNLHLICPAMVMGEVYMIAAPEYKVKAIEEKKFEPHDPVSIEKYVQAFEAINRRETLLKDNYVGYEYKYERVCLLVVDFRPEFPIVHETTKSLEEAGLIKRNSGIDYSTLGWKGFVRDLIDRHQERFPNRKR